ncbi:hypothetical protein [Pseudoflavonifractor capillosus]|uniref:hypothetical protein n=1 Tax=Pseudoflavonifractor capillosus TaxID=106588 RepID=UPI00195E0FBC|nr:hypothetical protein [Pseudoflavonifractor capillosus]MBM6680806.1 hypothetical protein [Pseudoflavonifractor capillosus]
MKKKIAIGAGILAALLVAGGLWYTWPQSFWAVTGLDPSRISGVSGHGMELSVEHGRARTTSWTMDHRGPGDEDYEALIALLERGSYRAKLSNLTAPFSDSQPGSEQWVTLNFAVDGEPFPVHIPVPQTMTIPIPDSYGSWQYDASDSQLQAEVLQYLKANGEQS